MKHLVGLGTGRCGTHSLAHLLSRQSGIHVQHERKPPLVWENEPTPDRHFLAAQRPLADIGFYYLPHVPFLLRRYPEMRFICLQRDRAATIQSFIRARPTDTNWFSRLPLLESPWDKSFPKYDCLFETAVGLYWDDYYRTAESLVCDRFRIFPMHDLNTAAGVAGLLEFAQIDDPVIECGIRHNRSRRPEPQLI